jgi:hypothetical protein
MPRNTLYHEGKLACVIFSSLCNVVFGNALVLMPQGRIKGASFCSWCSVLIENGFVVVTQGKLACVGFFSRCNVVFYKELCLCKKERWHVLAFPYGVIYFLSCASFP